MPRREGEWREYRQERVIHSAVVAGNIVRIDGPVITVVAFPVISDDDATHELRFGLTQYGEEPVSPEVKRIAVYAAHMLRLLRAADDGDQEAVDKLEQIVTEGSKSELSE
jgi:hypothetical protein